MKCVCYDDLQVTRGSLSVALALSLARLACAGKHGPR